MNDSRYVMYVCMYVVEGAFSVYVNVGRERCCGDITIKRREYFWIYFRSIEKSRPSTQTDLTSQEREREIYVLLCQLRYSFSLSLFVRYLHSNTYYDTRRTMKRRGHNQSVILLRGLFRAAISFLLKWPDPIRFHGVP